MNSENSPLLITTGTLPNIYFKNRQQTKITKQNRHLHGDPWGSSTQRRILLHIRQPFQLPSVTGTSSCFFDCCHSSLYAPEMKSIPVFLWTCTGKCADQLWPLSGPQFTESQNSSAKFMGKKCFVVQLEAKQPVQPVNPTCPQTSPKRGDSREKLNLIRRYATRLYDNKKDGWKKKNQNKRASDSKILFSTPKKERFLASPLNQLACYLVQTMQKPQFSLQYLSVIYLHSMHTTEIRISLRDRPHCSAFKDCCISVQS